MRTRALFPSALVAGLLLAGPVPAAQIQLVWSGSMAAVFEDTGTGQLAGTGVGRAFAGSFIYNDRPGPADISGFDADYPVNGFAVLARDGVAAFVGTSLVVTINDDEPLNAGPADLINAILSPDPPAMPGMPTDAWSFSALQVGAERGDDEVIINGIQWDIVLLSLDDALFDSLAFRAVPPGFDAVDVRAMLITEGDAFGNTVFEGILLLDNLTVVPVPPALWLLGSGLAALGLSRRRHRVT